MQSASFPGGSYFQGVLASGELPAFLAASRARAAATAFSMIFRASWGSPPGTARAPRPPPTPTTPRTSLLPNLVLVWPSNWGSGISTLTMAMQRFPASSPDRLSSFSFTVHCAWHNHFIVRVKADRNPLRWVPPPSRVWMLLQIAEHRLHIARGVLEGYFHIDLTHIFLIVNDFPVHRVFVFHQMLHKGDDAALVLPDSTAAGVLIPKLQGHASVQKGRFPQAVNHHFGVKNDGLKDLRIGPEGGGVPVESSSPTTESSVNFLPRLNSCRYTFPSRRTST